MASAGAGMLRDAQDIPDTAWRPLSTEPVTFAALKFYFTWAEGLGVCPGGKARLIEGGPDQALLR